MCVHYLPCVHEVCVYNLLCVYEVCVFTFHCLFMFVSWNALFVQDMLCVFIKCYYFTVIFMNFRIPRESCGPMKSLCHQGANLTRSWTSHSLCRYDLDSSLAHYIFSVCFCYIWIWQFCLPVVVPTLPEERLQTTGHATEEEEVQEQDDSGLQDPGCWPCQHDTCKTILSLKTERRKWIFILSWCFI